MENRFKLRISRMFRSSFGSCRSKNITHAIEKPIFLPENRQHQHQHHHHQLIDLFSPNPSVSRPKCSQNLQTEQTTSIINRNSNNSLLLSTDTEGQMCPPPPASPITPLNNFYHFQDCAATSSEPKEKKEKKTVNKRALSRSRSLSHHYEFPVFSYNGLFSSDEDDEDEEEDDKTTLFSSRSLSSDSSESFIRRKKTCKSNKKVSKTRQMKEARNHDDQSSSKSGQVLPEELKGKVKDSFAVVKRSRDPYNDFRTSMVEMIVEKQIFSAKDLENLLQCFLSLNSYHHHRVIIEVFTEIWEALFSEWS